MPTTEIAARDRLIVALDLPSVDAAEAMVARLGDSVAFYKIGYQLAYAGGLPLVLLDAFGLVTLEVVAVDPPQPAAMIAAAASIHNLTVFIFKAFMELQAVRGTPAGPCLRS